MMFLDDELFEIRVSKRYVVPCNLVDRYAVNTELKYGYHPHCTRKFKIHISRQ